MSNFVTYDSLDRIATATNPLGTFTYGYVGLTPRLQKISSTSGPTTNYSYFTVNQDVRLGEIRNLTHSGTALSKFDYLYNPTGTISSWTQLQDSGTPTVWNYQYDGADELRLSEQINLGLQSTTYNNLNQITGHSGTGSMQFIGTLSKPAVGQRGCHQPFQRFCHRRKRAQ